ncbi:MAG: hypothetical protein CMA77_05220 [Euryarchaeota archaeon]|nr:hypothetical protein [Euryarchaeota archaeon]|tara:strand:- start:1241 stop:1672 length:432 start_codon:yes stop_codon:yes gene_type:complete
MSGIIGEAGSKSGIIGSNEEEYHTTSFSNTWIEWQWNTQSDRGGESGLRIQRYGKLYSIHLCIYKTNVSSGTGSSVIKTLSASDIKLPKQNLVCGFANGYYGTGQYDQQGVEFATNGEITVFYNEGLGSTQHVIGNFTGVDHG